jgi:hypothetical protein
MLRINPKALCETVAFLSSSCSNHQYNEAHVKIGHPLNLANPLLFLSCWEIFCHFHQKNLFALILGLNIGNNELWLLVMNMSLMLCILFVSFYMYMVLTNFLQSFSKLWCIGYTSVAFWVSAAIGNWLHGISDTIFVLFDRAI